MMGSQISLLTAEAGGGRNQYGPDFIAWVANNLLHQATDGARLAAGPSKSDRHARLEAKRFA